MYKFIPVMALFCLAIQSNGQKVSSDEIVVGKKIPSLNLKGVNYFSRNEIRLPDPGGKWFILDFWNMHCITCIESFSRMSTLREKFKDKLEIILVGQQDRGKKIQLLYKKYRDKFNLTLPVLFDSLLFKRFHVSACPYIVIMNEKGIVKAITYHVEEKDMEEFFSGGVPVLGTAWNSEQEKSFDSFYDYKKPLLLNGNGGHDTDFLFRSILAKWNGDISTQAVDYISYKNLNRIQVTGVNLLSLYKLAYGDTVVTHRPRDFYENGQPDNFGKWWLTPILEIKDSAEFSYNYLTGKNIYNYSLIIPENKSATSYLQDVLKSQLFAFFHYKAEVQKRNLPYWRLELINDSSGLITREATPVYNSSPTGIKLVNMPARMILNAIWDYNQLSVFEDHTGIKQNIDLSIDCVMTDFDDIEFSLAKKGLRLVKAWKEMNAIVITDPAK